MNEDIDDRLVETLTAVAEQTPARDRWERVVAEAAEPSRTRNLDRSHYHLAGVAAALLALVAVGGVYWSSVRDTETTIASGANSYVLTGEVVVEVDPLVVVSASGPAPEFDTAALGTEIFIEVMDDVEDDVALMIERSATGPGRPGETVLTKVTLIGRVQGEPWIITVRDGPNVERIGGGEPDENFRFWSISGPDGGGGAGDPAPIDSLDFIAQPSADDLSARVGPGYSSPTGWMNWGLLPANTAVATFVDSDQQLWTRPRAGIAIFPAQFDDGESFTVQALDAGGEVITSYTETVSYGEDSARTNPKVGDKLGILSGTDENGRAVIIEPDGRLTALIFGAQWCQPCQVGIDQARRVVEELGPEMRVYSVPHYTDEPWPPVPDWPYSQLNPDLQSPLRSVGALPAVLILDGDNTIIGVQIGFEGLADTVEALAP